MVKRAVRYLIRYPRCVTQSDFHEPPLDINIFTDIDWAGDEDHRTSAIWRSRIAWKSHIEPLVEDTGDSSHCLVEKLS